MTTLQSLAPDLCLQLTALRAKYKDRDRHNIKNMLKSLLNEMPPPSVRDVCRRLKIDITTLYKKYKREIPTITARYNKYKKTLSVEREKQLRNEVERIATEIHKMGQYPSQKRVGKVLKSLGMPSNKSIRVHLRAVRLKLHLG
jgi:methylphosphotriester-DNA--protein-cysteine methyltransferase